MFPDFLRLKLAQGANREPDRSPKRYAPYPVWAWARVAAIAGYLCLPLAMMLFVLAWPILGLLVLVLGLLTVVPSDALRALTPEIIGGLLGSRYCPACGQSIFDRAPPMGYMPDTVRERWWPHRHCANCGHDLKVRTSD